MKAASNYTEVLLKREGLFRRLFWIRESQNRPGIRFGFIDEDINGAHSTYYEDGHCHLENKAGVLSEYPYIINSNKDDSFYILGYNSIPLDKGDFMTTAKTRDGTQIIELDRTKLGHGLGVFLYLVRRGREAEALKKIKKSRLHKVEELVYEKVTTLDYMTDFSLVTLISRNF